MRILIVGALAWKQFNITSEENQSITQSVMRKTISFLANFKHHRQLMLSLIYQQMIAHKKSQLKYAKYEIVSGLLCTWN